MVGPAAVAIRPATAADAAAIQAVARETWRATYVGLIPDADIETFLAGAYGTAWIIRAVTRLGDGYLVAVAGERLVGYAITGPTHDGDRELLACYVLPQWQGRGVGHALWTAVAAHVQRHGAESFVLWVLEGNAAARRFYERQGAVAVERAVNVVGSSIVPEIKYRVDLSAASRVPANPVLG